MEPVLLATSNAHKVAELRAILAPLGIEAEGLDSGAATPEETGRTFEANALLKARWYAARTGRWCLADDSGLEVEALGGAPGVISSHYATDGRETGLTREARDRANNERLLRELAGVPEPARSARFVCVLCVCAPSGVHAVFRGEMAGRIGVPGRVPAGSGGFGYDPLFLVGPAYSRTSAELTAEEKNAVSHRARAAGVLAAAVRAQGWPPVRTTGG